MTSVSRAVDPLAWRLSAVQVGAPVADLGLGAAYALADSVAVSGLGVAMAGLHAARGAAFLLSARGQDGVRLQHRIGIFAGEALVAAGHLVGAAGGGLWGLPLIAAGSAVSSVADFRYRGHFGIGRTAGEGQVSWGITAADAAVALAGVPVFSAAAGGGHALMSAAHYLGRTAGDKHSRHCQGFGHALLATGHLAAAAGAGPWALAPILGGLVVTSLQSARG